MKHSLSAILLMSFVSLVSCESESDTKEQPIVLPASTNTAPTLTPIKTENTTPNTNTATATLPVLNNNPAGALNPEHGKPGHRCDIAVGAPLNSAPANKTAAPILNPTTPTAVDIKPTATPVTTAPANAAPVTTVAPGMNPQHGQPGHRCDIAVGAPLNSPPNKAATTPVTANPVATAPVTTAVPVTATAPGMNPQHGQPGHRCDIAVGAPLNSKPKQ